MSSFEQESFFLEADSLLKVPDGIILPSPTDHKKNVEKERTCCFTGHRAKKLPCYGDRNDPRIKALCSKIYFEIKELYEKHGVRYFLTGMANGADLLCGEEVIRLKREFPDIALYCISPYVGHIREMTSPDDRYVYSMLRYASEKNLTLFAEYSKNVYRYRNSFLVEHSSYMLAIFDKHKDQSRYSGTAMTLSMARRAGLNIRMISDL